VLGVNNAAYHGDLFRLKGLIGAGADPSKPDYDGRTSLHVAASRGYEDIVRFLIKRGANVNSIGATSFFFETRQKICHFID
uniref:Uncharacterized protein n=1 Tax=Aegilops tauschii subsp. strangulata TaxID=200361 RepID=A0A453C2I6_AEGTS